MEKGDSMKNQKGSAEAAIIVSIVALAIAIVAVIVVIAVNQPKKTCIRSHTEHREAYTTLQPMGKVLMPITHPARDAEVCDEYQEVRDEKN